MLLVSIMQGVREKRDFAYPATIRKNLKKVAK